MNKPEVLEEMRGIFGRVPEWVHSLPENVTGDLWDLMKKVQLSEGALTPKFKELIGLAVSATLRCKYCIFFHTEAARFNGATEDEIKEAVMMGSLTNLFSTYLNGSQVDFERFKDDTTKMLEYARKSAPAKR